MKPDRKISGVFFGSIIAFLGIFSFFFLIAAFYFMPVLVENRILPLLARKSGIEMFHCDVRKIGLFGIELADIHVGTASARGLAIDSLKIEYGPESLYNKSIDGIQINGVNLLLLHENGQFKIPGLFPLATKASDSAEKEGFLSQLIEFTIKSLRIADGWVESRINGETFRTPFELEVTPTGLNMRRINLHLTLRPLGQPVALEGIADISGGGLTLDGTLNARLTHPPLNTPSPIPLNTVYTFKKLENNDFTFSLKTNPESNQPSGREQVLISLADYDAAMGQPVFKISGTVSPSNIKADFSMTFSEILFSAPGKKTAPTPDTKIQVPKLFLAGTFIKPLEKPYEIRASMNLSNAGISHLPSNTKFEGISADLPLGYPFTGSLKHGIFAIKSISMDNRVLGKVDGKWMQHPSGIKFEGSVKSPLIQDFCLSFNGRSEITRQQAFISTLHFEQKSYNPVSPIDLGMMAPNAKGLFIDGNFEIGGDVIYDAAGGVKASLGCKIMKGSLTQAEKKLNLSGIHGELNFVDLLNFKSGPRQYVSFEEAALGDIKMENGRVEFQIESKDAYFIEKSHFNWCNGHVETSGLRILRGLSDYEFTLYCNRVNLAMVLTQFGAAQASGMGTVNGRIPLRYRNGRMTFDNGFLFSTPGSGGTIRVMGTEMLTAGIDPDSPQFSQLDLAREALKNYDYEWAKLDLKTQGDDLLLMLKFNGKPSDPLPFVYQKEIGGFARVEPGQKGSVFQGIHLDLNFRLPLDKILQYRGVFNLIQKPGP
jgi:hypothetical protein